MLYACRSAADLLLVVQLTYCYCRHGSILYKTKLPFILVFNKTDVQPHAFALEWMQDFEAFQAALASHSGTRDAEGEPTYMNSLMNSMSLVLDEFYKHLKVQLTLGGIRWTSF
jgi:GTPase SAR1 family protein